MPAVEEINLVGKIQDISDVLAIANAAEMPFMSQIKKGENPRNTLVEYDIDKYDQARVVGVPDGKDVSTFQNTQKDRAPLYSRVMRMWRTPMVTKNAQVVTQQAGDNGNKMAQSKAKSTIELKQDWEAAGLGDQDSAPQVDADTGAVMRGMGSWTSATAQADTATAVPATYRPSATQIYSGAIASFLEDDLRALLQARWDNVKAPGDMKGFVGSLVKNQISDMSRFDVANSTQVSVRRFEPTEQPITINTSVDIYKGDFGVIQFFLDAFTVNSKAGDIVDMNMVELRAAQNPQIQDLPDLGGGPRAIADAIMTVVNRNPQTHCKIRGS